MDSVLCTMHLSCITMKAKIFIFIGSFFGALIANIINALTIYGIIWVIKSIDSVGEAAIIITALSLVYALIHTKETIDKENEEE